MTNLKDFCGKLTRLLVPAIAFSVGGCGATGLSTNTTVDATETSDYTSPGGYVQLGPW